MVKATAEQVCKTMRRYHEEDNQLSNARAMSLQADIQSESDKNAAEREKAAEHRAAAAGPSSSAADAERTCVVCLHGPQSHIVLPCLHLIYCGNCAGLMRGELCAFCRREVSEIKEVIRG